MPDKFHVRFPVRKQCPYVPPVRLVGPPLVNKLSLSVRVRQHVRREVIGADLHSVFDEVGDDVLAEIVVRLFLHCVVVKGFLEDFALKHVISHRHIRESRLAWNLGRVLGLLLELDDAAVLVRLDAPELRRFLDRHNVCRNRYVGVLCHVEGYHLVNIHLVDVIRRKDADPVSPEARDHVLGLIHRVRSALEPVLAAPHLRRYRCYEEVPASHCSAELPSPLDVLVEGLALELRQHVHRVDAAVDEVGEGKINDTVLRGEVDCRFCAVFREGHKTLAFSAGKYDA